MISSCQHYDFSLLYTYHDDIIVTTWQHRHVIITKLPWHYGNMSLALQHCCYLLYMFCCFFSDHFFSKVRSIFGVLVSNCAKFAAFLTKTVIYSTVINAFNINFDYFNDRKLLVHSGKVIRTIILVCLCDSLFHNITKSWLDLKSISLVKWFCIIKLQKCLASLCVKCVENFVNSP
jgi:hypothetical protein